MIPNTPSTTSTRCYPARDAQGREPRETRQDESRPPCHKFSQCSERAPEAAEHMPSPFGAARPVNTLVRDSKLANGDHT